MAVFVSDTFTEASDLTLASHVGEVGATWAVHPSYTGTILDDASLDRIYLNSAAAGGYYASGNPTGDYYVEADFYRLSVMSINVGLALGMDTSADTMILLRLNDNGTTQVWEVIDRTAGSNNSLVSAAVNIPTVGGSPVRAKMLRTGTAITVYFDGVQNHTFDVTTTITGTGKSGIRASGTASASTGIHVDNFSAGTLVDPANTVPYYGAGHAPYRRIVRVSNY